MKKILVLAACLLGTVSCEKFLEENPKSSISMSSFFTSAADGYAAVNILYRNGFPSYCNATSAYVGPNIMYGGYKSGFFDNLYKGQEVFVQYCQNLNIDASVSNSQLQGIWEPAYKAIVREANFAIKYLPGCPGLSDGEQKRLIAEARFFRALNYFYLVKMFGAVPLVSEPYESLDNLYVRRSAESKVYAFIVEDLEDALNHGGLADVPMPLNGFRISRGSVAALLADVYLNMAGYPLNDVARYADAARVAGSLAGNPAYGLIQHADREKQSAYSRLRTSDSEKEYLYTVEYNTSISDGGWRPTYTLPGEASTWGEFTYDITCLVYDPVDVLHKAYDITGDLRYRDGQYFHSSYTQVKGANAGTVRDLNGKRPFFWFEEDALLNTRRSEKDQVHYRLAEMYLIAAEAIAQTSGVTDEAAGYLAEVEARASLNRTKEQIRAELLRLSKDDFIREVWTEKIREFIFENKIWNDITRTRMYPAVVGGRFTFVNLIGAQNPWGKTFTEKDLYFPICSQAMQRNPELAADPVQ
ncbi:MAG: RagB/SusD family nutrient uptake outer membrane protein [Tannerella sp.]|jgi:hypothetical protein|nr:RagB/SusD family nutrient uptake outer membrane protein [Tannerella sp.]